MDKNTNLETLAIENVILNPAFDNNVVEYTAEVSDETTSLNILAVPESEAGKVKIIGGNNIVEGNNSISIIVTAPNGINTKEYKINVFKRSNQEQKTFEKEQVYKKEKLETIYKAQKTSLSSEIVKQDKKDNSFFPIVFIIATILIFSIITIKSIKRFTK